MNKTPNNIIIIVDFDLIVKNISSTGKNKNQYNKCDEFVKYEGENVKGTIITLSKKKDYMFILQAAQNNKSKPTKLKKFQDDDLTLKRVPKNKLMLTCSPKKENKKGKDVTMNVKFVDPNGNKCKAKWDPQVIVEPD
jgi:hypothetical protein